MAQVWKIAPGEHADHWDMCRDRDCILMRLILPFLLSAIAAVSAGCSRDNPGPPKEAPSKEEAVVIFRAADGRTLTMADLRGLTGTFQYEILGKDKVSAEAESLHKQARQAGGSGDYKKAITLLEQASRLAPAWPYPAYDMAFTYLLMKDAENARKHYRRAVELAPRGFFTAITALDALEREAKGDLPAGTYLAYLSLEWVDDAGKKADAVRQLVKRVPGFAPGWKELAMQTHTDAEKLAVIEKGLAANPDGETKGILQINKALVLDRTGDHDGAVRLLGELALDPASTFSTEHSAKVMLANVAKK
jgi:tetratricopeptide (TPR) repeat protein